MRGAGWNTERWKGRRAPTQDPSTNHLAIAQEPILNKTRHGEVLVNKLFVATDDDSAVAEVVKTGPSRTFLRVKAHASC